MKRQPLTIQLVNYVRSYYPAWVGGISIEKFAIERGYKAEHAGRRAREFAAGKAGSGLNVRYFRPIFEERKISGHVEYRYSPPPPLTIEQQKVEQMRILIEATK